MATIPGTVGDHIVRCLSNVRACVPVPETKCLRRLLRPLPTVFLSTDSAQCTFSRLSVTVTSRIYSTVKTPYVIPFTSDRKLFSCRAPPTVVYCPTSGQRPSTRTLPPRPTVILVLIYGVLTKEGNLANREEQSHRLFPYSLPILYQ